MTEEQKQKLRDYQKNRYRNMSGEQKQTLIENNKKHNVIKNEHRRFSNMTDEQKQKRRHYQKQYKENMTEEQKQKIRGYQREYHKKCFAAKKLNNKNENKK